MPDLLWDDVRVFFDPDLMGSLPDVSVEATGAEDWQAVLDLIRSKGWAYEYSEDGEVRRLPPAKEIFARRELVGRVLKVWPVPGVQANFWLYAEESIDFDVDLRELQGQERLDVLCGLLRALGRRLGKPVVMTAEGDDGHPVLGYEAGADRVVLMADPDA